MSDLLIASLPGHAGLGLGPVELDFAVLELFPDRAEAYRLTEGGSWRPEPHLSSLWDDCDDREEEIAISGVGVSFRIAEGPIITLGRDATLIVGHQNGCPIVELKDASGEVRVDYRGDEWRYAARGAEGARGESLWLAHPRYLFGEVWVPPVQTPGPRSRVSPLAERRAERQQASA